jgi:hypothetical protein
MPPKKNKPPAETKAQLMTQVAEAIEARWSTNPHGGLEYILNFFTAVDLVGIRDDLRRMDNNGV